MSVLVTIGVALAACGAADTSVDVSVTLEPPVIPFHKQAEYRIVVEAPGELEVRFPDMLGKFGGLDVYGVPKRSTKPVKSGRRRITETYTLDPVFVGNYAIEPAEVAWEEGEKAVVPSPGLRVRPLTEEELAAAEFFAPNAGPVGIERPLLKSWKLWAPVGVALAVALGLAAYLCQKRGKVVREAPAAPPWEVAYRRLRELDVRQLPKTGKYEAYYVDLSAILRYYIEDRFHLHAPERTTPEFLSEAAQSGDLSEGHQKLVAGFLRHCDRVKFAQHRPTLDEMERSFEQVLRFVDETVPAPQRDVEEAAA